MQLLTNTAFSRFFWAMMGLYLLNISVDPSDVQSHHSPENLSFNEQESIVEILVEKVFGFEDAIAEQDDADSEDYSSKNNFKTFVFLLPNIAKFSFCGQATVSKENFSQTQKNILSRSLEMTPPPPEA